MTIELDGPRIAPASGGKAKQLVIFLHGYGANGDDLIGLGRELAPFLPETAFVSPNAPEPLPGAPFGGRQWFPLHSLSQEECDTGVLGPAAPLEAFILSEAARYELPLSAVALVGFSQGTMMALHVGLRLETPLAGIVGFSGLLARAEHLASELKSKPPIMLIHGTADEVVPAQAIHLARMALANAGVSVQWQLRPGLGHSIDMQGLAACAQFLRTGFEGNETNLSV